VSIGAKPQLINGCWRVLISRRALKKFKKRAEAGEDWLNPIPVFKTGKPLRNLIIGNKGKKNERPEYKEKKAQMRLQQQKQIPKFEKEVEKQKADHKAAKAKIKVTVTDLEALYPKNHPRRRVMKKYAEELRKTIKIDDEESVEKEYDILEDDEDEVEWGESADESVEDDDAEIGRDPDDDDEDEEDEYYDDEVKTVVYRKAKILYSRIPIIGEKNLFKVEVGDVKEEVYADDLEAEEAKMQRKEVEVDAQQKESDVLIVTPKKKKERKVKEPPSDKPKKKAKKETTETTEN